MVNLDGIVCVWGWEYVCMVCVFEMMFFWYLKILYIKIEMFFEISLLIDYD